jgi:hypothetical protein
MNLSGTHKLDLETLDTLTELTADGVELRPAASHAKAVAALRRSSVAERVHIDPTLDAATRVDAPASWTRRPVR